MTVYYIKLYFITLASFLAIKVGWLAPVARPFYRRHAFGRGTPHIGLTHGSTLPKPRGSDYGARRGAEPLCVPSHSPFAKGGPRGIGPG